MSSPLTKCISQLDNIALMCSDFTPLHYNNLLLTSIENVARTLNAVEALAGCCDMRACEAALRPLRKLVKATEGTLRIGQGRDLLEAEVATLASRLDTALIILLDLLFESLPHDNSAHFHVPFPPYLDSINLSEVVTHVVLKVDEAQLAMQRSAEVPVWQADGVQEDSCCRISSGETRHRRAFWNSFHEGEGPPQVEGHGRPPSRALPPFWNPMTPPHQVPWFPPTPRPGYLSTPTNEHIGTSYFEIFG